LKGYAQKLQNSLKIAWPRPFNIRLWSSCSQCFQKRFVKWNLHHIQYFPFSVTAANNWLIHQGYCINYWYSTFEKLNSGLLNSLTCREEDLNPGPPDYGTNLVPEPLGHTPPSVALPCIDFLKRQASCWIQSQTIKKNNKLILI